MDKQKKRECWQLGISIILNVLNVTISLIDLKNIASSNRNEVSSQAVTDTREMSKALPESDSLTNDTEIIERTITTEEPTADLTHCPDCHEEFQMTHDGYLECPKCFQQFQVEGGFLVSEKYIPVMNELDD